MLMNKRFTISFLLTIFLAAGLVWSQNRGQDGGQNAPPARGAPSASPRSAPASRGTASASRPAPTPSAATSAQRGAGGYQVRGLVGQSAGRAPGQAGGGVQRGAPSGQQPGRAGGEYAGRGLEGGRGAPQGPATGGWQAGGAGSRGGVSAENRLPPNFSTPSQTVQARNGTTGRIDDRGQISSIRGHGVTINHGSLGGSTIIAQRADQTRLVNTGLRSGFVEHPVMREGQPYMYRTYVVNGHSWARVYRGAYYRGFWYYGYVPSLVFAPGFYGWAYWPWRSRIFFNWGWGPWFGWYSYYFWPFPYYVDASMWLTDYVISDQLENAYESGYYAGQAGVSPSPSSYAPLTPELKQAIADEVRDQLAAQSANPQSVSGGAIPAALDPKIRTFIVSMGLTEPLPSGAECSLSPGDVLTRIDDTPNANQMVRAIVSSSQANDCPAGSQLMIGVQDLQDMHNAFSEKLQDGLNALAKTQGKNGIPSGPPANPTPSAEGTAPPDANANAELQGQRDAATQAEQDVWDATQPPD